MTSHDWMRRRAPFDIHRRFEETLEILRHTVSLAAGSTVLTSYTTARGIALSRRECHLPGFDRAVQIATRTGFPIAVRPTGGRAAVMSDYSLVFEIFVATGEDDPGTGPIFEVGSGLVRDVLTGIGVDASVGEIPGEFCPGAHSISARGKRKLVGTAQRGTRGARLFSALLLLGIDEHVRDVLDQVNQALDLPWDRTTLGSIDDEVPGLSIAELREQLVNAWEAIDVSRIRGLGGSSNFSARIERPRPAGRT